MIALVSDRSCCKPEAATEAELLQLEARLVIPSAMALVHKHQLYLFRFDFCHGLRRSDDDAFAIDLAVFHIQQTNLSGKHFRYGSVQLSYDFASIAHHKDVQCRVQLTEHLDEKAFAERDIGAQQTAVAGYDACQGFRLTLSELYTRQTAIVRIRSECRISLVVYTVRYIALFKLCFEVRPETYQEIAGTIPCFNAAVTCELVGLRFACPACTLDSFSFYPKFLWRLWLAHRETSCISQANGPRST